MTTSTDVPTEIEPFFFGAPERQLFGCYHLPVEPARDCGVVFCYSIWQEYVRAHRACRRLTQQLAQAGFPALRFDYHGTGDSAGEDIDGDLDLWQANIHQAIDELRDRSGISTVCLIGLRLGASLAARVAAERRDVSGLVLWEPVVSGKWFIEETIHKHQDTILRFLVQPKQREIRSQPTELVGYAIGPALLYQIGTIDLLSARNALAADTLLIESGVNEPVQALHTHLAAQSAPVTYQHVPGFNFWTENIEKRLVPNDVLEAIVSWANEVYQ